MYPSSMGSLNMRSDAVPPAYVKAFPEYLRRVGYYTTNNSKTDYNFPSPTTAWDESSNKAHWKNRPDHNQPFFAVFNLTTSHESRVARQYEARVSDPSKKIHDAKLILPPYYPDTPKGAPRPGRPATAWSPSRGSAHRRTAAGDRRRRIAGTRRSSSSGATTGWALATRQALALRSGVKVPLIVRWPGSNPVPCRVDLVQFLDLAPTMLALGGVQKPRLHARAVLLGTIPRPNATLPRARPHGRTL
ncbi:MAG: hypothetical protein R2724_23840 [Bryobacterales bacterium]